MCEFPKPEGDLLMALWIAERESKLVVDADSEPVGPPQKATWQDEAKELYPEAVRELGERALRRLEWSAREHDETAAAMGWDPED